jgi:hypothetical protein
MAATLYEIVSEVQYLIDSLTSSDGEIDVDVEARLAEIDALDLPMKVQGYCQAVRQLEADAEVFAGEIERLARHKQNREQGVKRLKDRLKESLNLLGLTKVKTPLFTASVQNNSVPSVTVDEKLTAADLPPEFRRVVVTTTIDNSKIVEAFKAGESLPAGVEVKVGNHLRIR